VIECKQINKFVDDKKWKASAIWNWRRKKKEEGRRG
jgi:hypothetical protein